METAKSTIMAEAGKYCEHMTKLYKAGLLQTKVANSTRALGSLSLDTHFINQTNHILIEVRDIHM